MSRHFEPGEKLLIGGEEAEVIEQFNIGETPYIRAVFEEEVKEVCMEDVSIDSRDDGLMDLKSIPREKIHPRKKILSSKQFDVRTEAIRSRLAHEQNQLLSISSSLVRLEPYQLACVNQVMGGLRQRYLIADDVGLGKTIEAGLIFKELLARGMADRVLVVVPAHLQKKWERDMDRFFDIDLTLADRTWVESERRKQGEDANVWEGENKKLLTSMAFLRQDEFQPELEESFWDLVIVDEVHKASKKGDSPSKTAWMVERISHRSDSLLLLSATPHNGKQQPFRSLINYVDPFLMAPEESLSEEVVNDVMIRRGKETVYDENGERIFPEREVRTVPVEMSNSEKSFYDDVTAYVKEVYNRSEALNKPAVGFAMALMQKRLVSSIGAIRETLKRRLNNLSYIGDVELSAQTKGYLEGTDLDEGARERVEEELETITVTPDEELEEEIDRLEDLVDRAENLPYDSKAERVRRFIDQLLAENPKEKLLIFTEYRDTLDYLLKEVFSEADWRDEILIIHGGVDKDERARIEKEFNYGTSRILLATDAASEGIDLQHSCHIMANYELPWNPNKLEQRIGRLHRYGQEEIVKAWNFLFDNTRESEIFELLQSKIENIRSYLGNTADMVGIMEDLNVGEIIMESMRKGERPEAAKKELEEMIDKRQRTLREWYERTPLDCSTFDQESREKIGEVIEESEDIYGISIDLHSLFEGAVSFLGGSITRLEEGLYRVELPEEIREESRSLLGGPVTFDREKAIDRENLTFISPDSEVLKKVIERLLEEESYGKVGLKILPFLESPGILYNIIVRLEDGMGNIFHEDLVPVFVNADSMDSQQNLGKRILQSESEEKLVDQNVFRRLIQNEEKLREKAQEYAEKKMQQIKKKVGKERKEEMQKQLKKLKEYEKSEKSRIRRFIEEYKEEQKDRDMTIAIRGQKARLEKLEERIEARKRELRKKAKIISHAPEVGNWCVSTPTDSS